VRRDEVVVRPPGEGDHEAVSSFACSTGRWYEDEVQEYVRTRALQDARRLRGYAFLVAEEAERLIACMAYTPEAIEYGERNMILAMRLQVLAIATADQGRVLQSAGRLSDALLQTLIAEAAPMAADGLLTVIVARDNLRSVRLCERNGFGSQIAHSTDYVRMFGRFGTGRLTPD
jgi:L-amino acid N-acyltransferase YncA